MERPTLGTLSSSIVSAIYKGRTYEGREAIVKMLELVPDVEVENVLATMFDGQVHPLWWFDRNMEPRVRNGVVYI